MAASSTDNSCSDNRKTKGQAIKRPRKEYNEDTNTGTTNNFSIDSWLNDEDEDSNCNVCCYSSRFFLNDIFICVYRYIC